MPSPAPNSGIRDNLTRGTVGDFLRQQLKPGAEFELVTAYFFDLAAAAVLPDITQLLEKARLSTLQKKFEELYEIERPSARCSKGSKPSKPSALLRGMRETAL